jgi:hypothetical protein
MLTEAIIFGSQVYGIYGSWGYPHEARQPALQHPPVTVSSDNKKGVTAVLRPRAGLLYDFTEGTVSTAFGLGTVTQTIVRYSSVDEMFRPR